MTNFSRHIRPKCIDRYWKMRMVFTNQLYGKTQSGQLLLSIHERRSRTGRIRPHINNRCTLFYNLIHPFHNFQLARVFSPVIKRIRCHIQYTHYHGFLQTHLFRSNRYMCHNFQLSISKIQLFEYFYGTN